jgi:hypothetical protein
MPFDSGNQLSQKTGIDLEKLAAAVAMAESGTPLGINDRCGTLWHTTARNCWSLMSWTGGKRHLQKFKSLAEGKTAFKALWMRSYGGGLPTMKEAVKYSGNDRPRQWLQTVLSQYYSTH